MDSKRKANGHTAGAYDPEERAVKRVKPNIDLTLGESVETTREYGLSFVDQIRQTKDKSGRPVATNFLTLPDKKQIPEYYKVIKMPIALDTIEKKLERLEFPNLTALESYFKRMVANAKEFNERGSEIFDDAERIRKALSNYMTRHNPAYKSVPGYVAFPTPIPEHLLETNEDTDVEQDAVGSEADADGEPDEENSGLTSSRATASKGRNRVRPSRDRSSLEGSAARSSMTPSLTDAQFAQDGYSSLSFQQAQEKLIAEMLRHTAETDGILVFEPFFNLPPRALRDYYQVIPNPISIRQIQKKIRGVVGRAEATGFTLYKTWKSLEDEISAIWKNAWHYNEDGSEISLLAKEFQTFFNKRIAKAKQAVTEPTAHKLKLKLSSTAELPKITLRMGPKASPADSPAGTPGLTAIDSPRNGISQRRNPFGGAQSSSTVVPNLGHLDRGRSMSDSVASPTPSSSALVKNEDGPKASPSILPPASGFNQASLNGTSNASQNNGNSMLPPTGSNLPNYGSFYGTSGNGQSYGHQIQHTPTPAFDSKWRAPGKDASDAMITNLNVATHPGLNILRHFNVNIGPSATMAQQSVTLNLQSSQYYLQIKPKLAPSLLERQHKLFVTSGTTRLHSMPTLPGQPIDSQNPLFEARLLPGVNRIEIELIAAVPKGKGPNGQDVELEKIIIFAHLLRN